MGFGSAEIIKKFGRRDRGFLKFIEEPPPISQSFLLDLFPGAQIAYSLRKLNTAYTGFAIRVERFDAQFLDVGFLPNGDLDVVPLQTFIGAGDGIVTIWYDQSGNGFNLSSVGATKPAIILSGVLQTIDGLPSVKFKDNLDLLLSSSLTPSQIMHLFAFMRLRKNSLSDNGILWNLASPNEGSGEISVRMFSPGGEVVWNAGDTSDRSIASIGITADMLSHILTVVRTAGTLNQKIRLDMNEFGAQDQFANSNFLGQLALGNLEPGGSLPSRMDTQEYIVYPTNQLATMLNIELNMWDYWTRLIQGWTRISQANFLREFPSLGNSPRGIDWKKDDGTKVFIAEAGVDGIVEYTAPTPWSLENLVQTGFKDINGIENFINGLSWNQQTGEECLLVGGGKRKVIQLDTLVPWDASALVDNGIEFDPSEMIGTILGIYVRPGRDRYWLSGQTGHQIWEYEMTTPGDILTSQFIQVLSVQTEAPNPQEVAFKDDDGSEMYVASNNADAIKRFHLSTGWDISTAVLEETLDVSNEDNQVYGLSLKSGDAKRLYITGNQNNKLFSYAL